MAKKNAQMDEEIIDLTELIEPGAPAGRAAAAYARASAAPAAAEDDFDAILQAPAAKPASANVDPNESLDMSDMGGIDNLLETLDIPAQPREVAPEPAAQPDPDELDSVLDDLLPPPAAKPSAGGAAAKKQPDADDFDLDAMLGEDLAAEPQDKKKPAPEKVSEMDADFDDILASLDEPSPAAKQAPPAATKPSAAPEEEMAADLDDIMSGIDVPEPPAPKPAQAPAAPPPNNESEEIAADLDDFLEAMDAPETGGAASATSTQAAAPRGEGAAAGNEDAGTPEAAEDDAGVKPPAPPAGPESADDFMDELDRELDSKASSPPLADAEPQKTVQESLASQAPAHARSTLPAEVAAREGSHPAYAVQAWPEDMIAGLCQGIASAQNSGDRKAIQEFSRELGAQSAHVQDMGGQLAQLAKRILACESKVAASRARISGLEKGLEAAAALEDLLKAGSPLHAGFMSLISTAVGNALQGFQPPANDEAMTSLEKRLLARLEKAESRLEELGRTVAGATPATEIEERMARLEGELVEVVSRFEGLEEKLAGFMQNFEANMEKAAASTVAQVLQEEISKLMQE